MKIAYVEWFDAVIEEGPLRIEDFSGLTQLHSAGVFIREDNDMITIAQDACPEHGDWRQMLHIPKVNIIRKKIINIPEK